MANMGWGTFLLWGVFDVIIAIFSFLFLKETKGLSLEAIAHTQFKKGAPRDEVPQTKQVDEAHDDQDF